MRQRPVEDNVVSRTNSKEHRYVHESFHQNDAHIGEHDFVHDLARNPGRGRQSQRYQLVEHKHIGKRTQNRFDNVPEGWKWYPVLKLKNQSCQGGVDASGNRNHAE